MTSVTQHVMTTIVASHEGSASHNGVAWIEPSPVGADLSPDADGEYNPYLRFVVDISHMLSRVLGKQMSMTETYRVTGIKIGIKNHDDVDDNDRGMVIGGYLYWHTPTKHKIDAIQACRKIERASEEDQIDGDSLFLRTGNRYTGFRFNWNDDEQVKFPTNAGDVSGWNSYTGSDEWNMWRMLQLYSATIDPEEPKDRQLFISKVGHYDLMRWACGFNNAMHVDPPPTVSDPLGQTYLIENPGVHDFVFQAEANRHIDVMGGLILGEVQWSNTIPNGDVSPDDYYVNVEITVEGWSSW